MLGKLHIRMGQLRKLRKAQKIIISNVLPPDYLVSTMGTFRSHGKIVSVPI